MKLGYAVSVPLTPEPVLGNVAPSRVFESSPGSRARETLVFLSPAAHCDSEAAAASGSATAGRGTGPLEGSFSAAAAAFSAVSKPNFASKYALESSRRDLHNALLCTVLNAQNFRQKSLKILLIFPPNFVKFDKFY